MNTTTKKVFQYQGYHLAAWIVLGSLLYIVESRRSICWTVPEVWGWSVGRWLLVSWILAALHQGWVWFFWRWELYGGKISRWFGHGGFLIYRIGFVLLALARLLTIVMVALAAPGTLEIPRWLSLGPIVITTPFILWGIYSVAVYFGVTRAFGADHFDERYRSGTLETRGIFRYVPNTMYTVILLALYHPALLVGSRLGLMASLAHHLFVWTHYFCTERPDMREIYG